MKLLSVRHGSECLSLHAAPRLQGPEEKPPAPSLQEPRGVFMGSWYHFMMFWRWRRRACYDCDRFGGHCHEPHTVMVWE